MSNEQVISLTNAALYENNGEIVLRGVLTVDSLPLLKVADYQREILPGKRAVNLESVLASGSSVPDITLGMRGGAFTDFEGGTFTLDDKVFIIDGLQRTNAAIRVAKKGEVLPRLGAVVHFNTTEASERILFRQLNTLRTKLSANVLLYNERHSNPQVKLLYELCNDSTFALYQRVNWKQLMTRSQLIHASTLVRIAAVLHTHFGGDANQFDVLKSASGLARLKLPRQTVRDNTKTFWGMIDAIWKVREITYKERAPHIRQSFLMALARLFNAHSDFWEDSVLKIPQIHRKKLATFPLNDPGIATLCASGGNSASILLPMLVDHLNANKKHNYLKPFNRGNARLPIKQETGGEAWGQPN